MTQSQADQFAASWKSAWNARDLERILEHYSDDIEFVSPFAAGLMGDSSVRGRESLRTYFARALDRFPDLQFSHLRVFPGENSLVLCYRSVNDLDAAETMVFDEQGLVRRVWAHYSAQTR